MPAHSEAVGTTTDSTVAGLKSVPAFVAFAATAESLCCRLFDDQCPFEPIWG